jgi:hypothetical protein
VSTRSFPSASASASASAWPIRSLLGALALLALAAPAVVAGPAPACPIAEPKPGPGAIDPFRPPDPRATALNAEGKTLYRQGRWDEARARYRAAEAADPEFLAPALNIACSFVRQERFAEATREVLRLLDRAFLPWSREVLIAADLGALKAQPQMEQIRQALVDGARRWGAGLQSDLLFVARQREPLKLPPAPPGAGSVVLVLGLHQEVFAWSPATGRYRQLTAEDGRVLAFAPSLDRNRLLYVTAEKLVRRTNGPSALRGVALHTLVLSTMTAGTPVSIDGDLNRLAIVPLGTGFAFDLEGDKLTGGFMLDGAGTRLVPTRRPDQRRAASAARLVVLTSAGVTAGPPRALPGDQVCPLVVRPGRAGNGIATIEIRPAVRGEQSTPLVLRPRFGAGLSGLSIP